MIAFIIAGLEMVAGYYVGGGILLGIMDENFKIGFEVSLLDIPYNFIQMGVSVAIAYIISIIFVRIPYTKEKLIK